MNTRKDRIERRDKTLRHSSIAGTLITVISMVAVTGGAVLLGKQDQANKKAQTIVVSVCPPNTKIFPKPTSSPRKTSKTKAPVVRTHGS